MKHLALLLLLPANAHAWEFKPGLPCLLTHTTSEAQIELSYDPTAPLYSLIVTRNTPWPKAAQFEMRFDGPQARRIGTDRHRLSEDGLSLSVEDRGFGNVLDGLGSNITTTAITGGTSVTFPLEGIAQPLAQFRDCPLPVS